MPLNLCLKWDEIMVPFLLTLIRASEKHPPAPGFLCVRLTNGNAPGSITRRWEALPWDGLLAQKLRWCLPEMQEALLCLVWRPAWGFPSPRCCPSYQIILAGALIQWMLYWSYKLSSSSRRGEKKKNCNEQKQDLKLLSFLHWDRYSHAYFLNKKGRSDFGHQ